MGQPVVHFEIVGRNGKALRSFYSDLFGWDAVGVPANPDYAMVGRENNTNPEGIGIGGAISSLPEQPSSTWQGPIRADGYEGHVTVYVEVPDVDAALGQAERLGGKRMLGPDGIPGGPTIGAFADPEGHLIGIVGSQAQPPS